jgi:hypothetical protein
MLAEGMNLVEVREVVGYEDVKSTMKQLYPHTRELQQWINQRNSFKLLRLFKLKTMAPKSILTIVL